MKSFCYKVKVEAGVHARPAGMLSRMAAGFDSSVKIERNGESVQLEKLLALMQMNIRCGDVIKITADGSDEETAIEKIKAFCEQSL